MSALGMVLENALDGASGTIEGFGNFTLRETRIGKFNYCFTLSRGSVRSARKFGHDWFSGCCGMRQRWLCCDGKHDKTFVM